MNDVIIRAKETHQTSHESDQDQKRLQGAQERVVPVTDLDTLSFDSFDIAKALDRGFLRFFRRHFLLKHRLGHQFEVKTQLVFNLALGLSSIKTPE